MFHDMTVFFWARFAHFQTFDFGVLGYVARCYSRSRWLSSNFFDQVRSVEKLSTIQSSSSNRSRCAAALSFRSTCMRYQNCKFERGVSVSRGLYAILIFICLRVFYGKVSLHIFDDTEQYASSEIMLIFDSCAMNGSWSVLLNCCYGRLPFIRHMCCLKNGVPFVSCKDHVTVFVVNHWSCYLWHGLLLYGNSHQFSLLVS